MDKTYETVLIDADDTLFDYPRAERLAFARTCERFGLENTQELRDAYREINREQWRRLERGETDQKTLRTERFRLLFQRIGRDLDAEAVGRAYVEELAAGSFLLPDAEEICAYLAERYTLAVVTNGIMDVQRSRIARSALRDFVRILVISEEVGASKPDPRIFESACRAAGALDRTRVIMIGDSLESDIRGGAAFGIDTCWFNPGGSPNPTDLRPTYEIRSLRELKTIL